MKRVIARLGVAPILFVLGLLLGSVFTGTAFAIQQPHMVNALQSLRNAQNELNQASTDKAGHRVQALNLIAQAIQQVKWGIQASNQGN
jgi:hypothetical protein